MSENIKMYKGYKIEICQDEDPMNPRDDDNLGTMVCFHGRYTLGDKHTLKTTDFNGWKDMYAYLKKELKACIILPLYLYDHSGVSMSTSLTYPYNDQWDAGQVGFIYITAEKIRKEYNVKSITKQSKEKVAEYLKGEVETYNKFLTGDIYGFVIKKLSTCDLGCEHEEVTDSCWGFYDTEYCIDEAKAMVDGYEKEAVPA